ncbi:hypothetical protein EYF80_022094 [Liparis tanakae]|uniref:Uncharacterized protein n=1 Tax=Liparis tanakae TaxID=230148 RepID=A0A4Z2HPV3_9TELE|nr:hypothetical protein EYF80_022094 [Liparis tanakae]
MAFQRAGGKQESEINSSDFIPANQTEIEQVHHQTPLQTSLPLTDQAGGALCTWHWQQQLLLLLLTRLLRPSPLGHRAAGDSAVWLGPAGGKGGTGEQELKTERGQTVRCLLWSN